MPKAADIARLLERTFSRIERERMADVPILNERINVEAVAFRQWQDMWLGVLVTPWFMNLMLLPLSGDAAADTQPGESESVAFPCGDIACLHGYEEGIGRYLMCSLYSPMFDFEDQAAAVATAQAVLAGVLEPAEPSHPATSPQSAAKMSRRQLLRGELEP